MKEEKNIQKENKSDYRVNEANDNPLYKRWYLWAITFVVMTGFAFLALIWQWNVKKMNFVATLQVRSNENNPQLREPQAIFTSRLFDPTKVSHILPLGELNGGYIETQTINGVVINVKKDINGKAVPVEIYAPTDMTLEDYSYFPDPRAPERPVQWHLGFRISKEMKLSFDHITWVPDAIKNVTPPTQNSSYVSPQKKLSFKAGDLIAKSSGTNKANNWNIYLRDNKKVNNFVNQERYEKTKEIYGYVNASCPFDYYEELIRQEFLALMGYYSAGQSKTCGSNSRDVSGTISGLWHLNKEGIQEEYRGQYATPFSIYKTSADEIIIYEINKQRYIIGSNNKTYKDPATVTDSHCYNLTEYGDDRSAMGYAYFNIISGAEMQMNYSATGSCPTSFPEVGAITYYR